MFYDTFYGRLFNIHPVRHTVVVVVNLSLTCFDVVAEISFADVSAFVHFGHQ